MLLKFEDNNPNTGFS